MARSVLCVQCNGARLPGPVPAQQTATSLPRPNTFRLPPLPPPSPLPAAQTADLSAKNLGDEGFAYVVDALSFNDK